MSSSHAHSHGHKDAAHHGIPVITIDGPTASGKTSLAVALAYLLGTEIISADSRQVYRRMDLGTGKDLEDYIIDGHAVPYHLIDIWHKIQSLPLPTRLF